VGTLAAVPVATAAADFDPLGSLRDLAQHDHIEVEVWETIEAELQAAGFAIVPIDELHPVLSN
jgi:hypothetical protein